MSCIQTSNLYAISKGQHDHFDLFFSSVRYSKCDFFPFFKTIVNKTSEIERKRKQQKQTNTQT